MFYFSNLYFQINPSILQIIDAFPPTCSVDDCTINDSNKLRILFELVISFDKQDEKTIIISTSASTLDLIEALFKAALFEVYRIDRCSSFERNDVIKKFNKSILFDTPNQIMLIQEKTRLTGLDLINASKIVLFDSDFKAANDLHSKTNMLKNGDPNVCHIYRIVITVSVFLRIIVLR